MRIGVLTYHYALNCGAFLQALAMQEYLRSEGHQVEFINYENDNVNLAYRLFRFRVYDKRRPFKSLNRFLNECVRSFMYPKFRKSVRNHLCIGDIIQTRANYDLTSYDRIIIGSDQLWNKNITRGFDYFYCAQFKKHNNQKVIGYAISMNKPQLSTDETIELQQVLSNFDCLSVRESTTVDLLKPLTTKPVDLVLDPTFLLSREEWSNYVSQVPEQHYICCYPVLNQEAVKKRAREIARSLNKKLVILEPVGDAVFLSGNKKIDTPLDFLSYIANADMVLTSSFHGTAFSINMQKDFYVLGDDKGNVRMKSFLEELGIPERIISLNENIDINNHIDYNVVDKRLLAKINKSKQFLRNSLNS